MDEGQLKRFLHNIFGIFPRGCDSTRYVEDHIRGLRAEDFKGDAISILCRHHELAFLFRSCREGVGTFITFAPVRAFQVWPFHEVSLVAAKIICRVVTYSIEIGVVGASHCRPARPTTISS